MYKSNAKLRTNSLLLCWLCNNFKLEDSAKSIDLCSVASSCDRNSWIGKAANVTKIFNLKIYFHANHFTNLPSTKWTTGAKLACL
jgi:hypothetical protein